MDDIEMSSTLHVTMNDLGEIVQRDARVKALLGDLPRKWELVRVQEEGHAMNDEVSVALVFASERVGGQ